MTFGLSATAIASLGTAALGAYSASQSGKGKTETATKDPWGPAVPWLTANLKTGQDLQGFYQNNPFSDQQKIGMQNQLGMADQFQQQMMPGLMDFANRGMTGQYQRASGGAPGSMSGYGGAQRPAGLLSNGAGPFSAPKMQAFGQIDWDAQNPFSEQNQVAQTAAPATSGDALAGLTPEQIQKLLALIEERTGGEGISDGGFGNGGFGGYGGGLSGGGFGATGEA